MLKLFEHQNYFHPAVAPWRDKLLLTMHRIHGADNFSAPCWSISTDNGQSWSTPVEIAPLKNQKCADFRPLKLPDTEQVVIMGLADGQTVYLSFDGDWHEPQVLESPLADDFRGANLQSALFSNGDLLIPFFFRNGNERFQVVTRRFGFDGRKLTLKETGNILSHNVGRGFIEPSVVNFRDNFYLTLRAEDGCAYWAASPDGLNWPQVNKWIFDNGETINTSSTQQHWLKKDGKLFLVYTRQTPENRDIFRWRAPLFAAQFSTEKSALLQDTETIVFPIELYRNRPNLMGNFHVMNNIITDAAWWYEGPGIDSPTTVYLYYN